MFKKILITALSSFFSMSVMADGQIFEGEIPIVWSSIITLSGGPAWSSPGQNQTLYPQFPFPQFNNYYYNTPTKILGAGEVFFGLQRIIYPGMTGELGLGLAGASNANPTGTVNVNGVPNVSTFKYTVQHARAEFKGKLIANSYKLQPYVSGSLGVGWNFSGNYNATTAFPLFYPAPGFADQTTLAFSYTLGLGVQTLIAPNWQVGMGYEFADWGKNTLGFDQGSQIAGPGLSHLYTNQLLFSLSYLF